MRKVVMTYWRWPHGEPRTLADDLVEHPRPVDATPHQHFHDHGDRHAHEHVHSGVNSECPRSYSDEMHPEDHAHSSRKDLPRHE